MLKKKIIFSDFDGTLAIESNVSKENIDAINKYVSLGGIFAVCSGRMPRCLIPFLKKYGIGKGIVICYNGAEIINIDDDKVIIENHIESNLALQVLKLAKEHDIYLHTYHGEHIYVDRYNDITRIYEQMGNIKIDVLNTSLFDFYQQTGYDTAKFFIIDEEEKTNRFYDVLVENFSNELHIMKCDRVLEVVKKGVSKANAIRLYAKMFNLTGDDIITVGDGANDIEMLKGLGTGIAVANATPETKREADIIYKYSCQENAIAKIIEEFCI